MGMIPEAELPLWFRQPWFQPLIADMITAAAAVSAAVFKAFDLNMVTDLSDRGQIIRLLPVISAG